MTKRVTFAPWEFNWINSTYLDQKTCRVKWKDDHAKGWKARVTLRRVVLTFITLQLTQINWFNYLQKRRQLINLTRQALPFCRMYFYVKVYYIHRKWFKDHELQSHDSLGFLLPCLQRHCLFSGFFKKPPTPENQQWIKTVIGRTLFQTAANYSIRNRVLAKVSKDYVHRKKWSC